MKAFFNFIKTALSNGFLFLLPLFAVLILLQEGLKRLAKLVKPLGDWIAVKSVIGIQTPYILAFFLLLLVSFLAGLIGKTKAAASVRNGMDAWLAAHIPGYLAAKKSTKKLVMQSPSRPHRTCALVKVGDFWRFAFLMEKPRPGWATVFLPDSPGANSGSVLLVPEDRIKTLKASYDAVSHCLANLGDGSQLLLENEASLFTALEAGMNPPSKKGDPQ